MTLQLSEIVRLAVAVVVLPFIYRIASQLRMSSKSRPLYSITIAAIYVSYVLSVVETYVAGDFLNAVQHLCYGVAGIAAALCAYQTRVEVLRDQGGR
ncbi:MAG: hypothetical protein OEV43_05050 [Coriobacteriia bacterium]|nr:hypothetical protein [Coriobacteriia bacterium]